MAKAPKKNRSNLAHIFLNMDLRMGHDGLKDHLKSKKIKVNEGDFVVFLNHNKTIIKAFCNSMDAILHVKHNGKRLDMGTIKYLPKYCNGEELNLSAAIEENIKDMMKKRGQ